MEHIEICCCEECPKLEIIDDLFYCGYLEKIKLENIKIIPFWCSLHDYINIFNDKEMWE
jgi:hypothetical protein